MTTHLTDTPLSTRKRAVIIGASSGIGADLARELVKRNYFVALVARRGDALENLCAEFNSGHRQNARFYTHDVTDFDETQLLFQNILSDLQRIDAIIYNAGIMPKVEFTEYDFKKNEAMVCVNTLGAMAWLEPAAVLFEKIGAGQIVGISSVAADRGRVKNPGYNASKAAFDTFLEGLRNRLTRRGVHVLTVRPGPTDTALTKEVGGVMMVPPQKVAGDIARAMQSRKQVIYTPGRWALIMFIVRNIPSIIFRRLNF